ncbi:hypothetical protein BDR05DRAFT_170007 [Suillus weaverae]|nr:hypothetical protein BDR05DRAFT_170007 [Suillus weaverae]
MLPHPQQKEHNARRSNYRINLRAKLVCNNRTDPAPYSTLYDDDTHARVNRLRYPRLQKTTFLLNTHLLPSSSQVNLQPNMTLPTSETAPPTIHANSHASMLSDPSSVSTSALTLAAIQEEGEEGGSLLDALISALVEPVPFGVDGEIEKDEEFQESVVKILYTFATSCDDAFSAVQKCSL